MVHIAGVGDFSLAGVTGLSDPCPLPSAAKKKGLRDKEKLFYAPMSGLGDLLYDKDAVYINIKEINGMLNPNNSLEAEGLKTDSDEAPKPICDIEPLEQYQSDGKDDDSDFDEESADSDLDDSKSSVQDEGVQEDSMQKSEDGVDHSNIKGTDEENGGDKYDDHNEDNDDESTEGTESCSGSEFSDGDNEDLKSDEDGMGNISKWRASLVERASKKHNINLMQLVYGKSAATSNASVNEVRDDSENEESDEDEFFKPKGQKAKNLKEGLNGEKINTEDCSKSTSFSELKNWKDEEVYESVCDRFTTGDWSKGALRNQMSEARTEEEDDKDGDFEDVENGDKFGSHKEDDSINGGIRKEDDDAVEERRFKKLALRAKFDSQYPFHQKRKLIYNMGESSTAVKKMTVVIMTS
ncbi:hypothetical protein GQ457_09G027840 [Hibiscus cannabinus]